MGATLGGYPSNRQTARTVQIYTLASASGGGTSIGGNFGSWLNQVFFPTVSCD